MERSRPATFGELLRRHRIAAGLTQETLAERAHMSLAAIGKLERGARQRPYRGTVGLLAGALSLSEHERAELERAVSLGAAGVSNNAQDDAPAIRLPMYFSSFVGRERELMNVEKMLAEHRLVTLVGAGGVGKTRLAVRAVEQYIAADLGSRQLDGAWFTDFSSLRDEAMLAMTLGMSVGLQQCRTIDVLVNYLRSQTFLLVLDNCEHLLDPIALAVTAILTNCPRGQILATSRQALSVDGEHIYRVPPLDLTDSIRLFEGRAEETDSRFALRDNHAAAITEICRRLDGIALAIELAAARTSAFSPEDIAQQIATRFSILSGGNRTALPRHKTMLGLFDWSYDLLDDDERELFRRSSIFANGFTLDLLCALYPSEERAQVPALLASLVDKSFVHSDILGGPRYRLLEPARQYARDKLVQAELEDAAGAHVRALVALAEDMDARLDIVPDQMWTERIEREQENFRAAFEWALLQSGDMEPGLRLAASRSATWSAFATGEVRRWIDAAAAVCTEQSPVAVRAKLSLNAARATVLFGPSWLPDYDPESGINACLHALGLQLPGDERAVAATKMWLGIALRDAGRFDESYQILSQARDIARAIGARTEFISITTTLGVTRYGAGDFDQARTLVAEALKIAESAGSNRVAADARAALAEIEFACGHIEEALALNERTIRYFREHANLLGIPLLLTNSAGYLIALGRFEEARDYAAEALRRTHAIGITNGGLWAMQHLAAIAILDNVAGDRDAELVRAAALIGFVDEATSRRKIPRYFSEQRQYDEALALLREAIGDDALARCIADGRTWSEERALAEAL